MSEPLLRVAKLKKYFPVTRGLVFMRITGWVKAVDELSFEVHEGETFALVGESGCGKTTTSRVVLRLLQPTAGSVWLDGKNIWELEGRRLKEYRSSVQSVFQDPFSSLNARMKVGKVIAEPLVSNDAMPSRARKERVEEVLLQVGLSPQDSRRFPHEFSGGQRQRIAVARALTLHPKLVVLDEPVSALDVSIQAQVMNLLKDLQEQLGTTYLLIAHNLATIRYMSHHVGIMYLGRIVEEAPTEELFTRPLHPYTQALMSAALPSHPGRHKKEIVLRGEVPSPVNIPPGCRFHPRCPRAMPACKELEPASNEVAPGHHVACHLYCERIC